MHTLLPLLLLVTPPALASDGYAGGGVKLHAAPGLECIGGVGISVEGDQRIGGEGSFCGGRDRVAAQGGLQVAWQSRAPGPYATLGAGLGLGWQGGFDEQDQQFDAVFAFARPFLGAGLPLGFGAIEGGLYAMLPLNLVQVLDTASTDTPTLAHAGLEISFLFGDFSRRRPKPEPPPPRRAEREPEEEDEERPLAIPAETPSPGARKPR